MSIFTALVFLLFVNSAIAEEFNRDSLPAFSDILKLDGPFLSYSCRQDNGLRDLLFLPIGEKFGMYYIVDDGIAVRASAVAEAIAGVLVRFERGDIIVVDSAGGEGLFLGVREIIENEKFEIINVENLSNYIKSPLKDLKKCSW